MRPRDLFILSTRMFRTRPTRTWLTILGIGVGIGAVLFLVSLGYGLQNIILQKIVFNQAILSLTVSSQTEAIPLNQKVLDQIAEYPEVKDMAPLASFISQGTFKDLSGNIELKAVDAPYFDYAGVSPFAGSIFGADDTDSVIISSAVLKLFAIEKAEDILGQEMSFQAFIVENGEIEGGVKVVDIPKTFKIKGVVEDSQSSFAYFPLNELKNFLEIKKYESAQVRVKDSRELDVARDKIIELGFLVTSLSETVEQANKIFRGIQIVLGLFGAVSLVVSAIGMFNTMTVTLLERTNEIGIMRSLGGSKGDIRNLFLTESVVIGFLGGVVGIGLGIAVGNIFNFGVNILATRLGGSKVELFFYPGGFLLIIVAISTAIGFFSGVFPARRASIMNPLDALRYK